jgi:hypothetical protein
MSIRMKQITSIEELQDAVAMESEIYEVDNYVNDKDQRVFFKNFRFWNINDEILKMPLKEWAESNTLFHSMPIDLDIKKYEK